MTLYSVIEIETIEPIKIGAGGNKKNQIEPSKDYIPGSTIRGASIAELIKSKLFVKNNEKDILTKICFYNAYPYVDKKIFIPNPNHLRIDKHEWRKKQKIQEVSEENENVKVCNLIVENENPKFNSLGYNFIANCNNDLVGFNTKKEYRLHHSKIWNKNNKKEKDNIFRYQAISSKQIFRSIIRYDNTMEKIINKLFNGKEFYTYIGGSKGSGYGKCKLKLIKKGIDEYNQVLKELGKVKKIDKDIKNQLVITCLSDCLFRDKYGQSTNEFPIKRIAEKLDIVISDKNKKYFLKSSISEGYNAKWKARYPKETIIKSGSVFCYEVNEDISESKIIEIESQLYGQRTVDGYGWISINDSYPTNLQVREATCDNIPCQKTIEDLEDKETLQIIISGLGNAKLRWLRSSYMKDNTIKANLKNHQARILLDVIRNNRNIEIERNYMKNEDEFSVQGKNFILLKQYIDGTNDSQLDMFAKKMLNTEKGKLFYKYFDKVKTGNNKKQQFIKEFVEVSLEIIAKKEEGIKDE